MTEGLVAEGDPQQSCDFIGMGDAVIGLAWLPAALHPHPDASLCNRRVNQRTKDQPCLLTAETFVMSRPARDAPKFHRSTRTSRIRNTVFLHCWGITSCLQIPNS